MVFEFRNVEFDEYLTALYFAVFWWSYAFLIARHQVQSLATLCQIPALKRLMLNMGFAIITTEEVARNCGRERNYCLMIHWEITVASFIIIIKLCSHCWDKDVLTKVLVPFDVNIRQHAQNVHPSPPTSILTMKNKRRNKLLSNTSM